MKYSVLFDVDSILNTFIETTADVLKENTGQALDVSMITEYQIEKCLPAELVEQIYEIWGSKNFWDRLMPVAGAQECIKKLLFDGIEVFTMSDCSPHTMAWKTEWLREHFSLIPKKNIIFGAPKHMFNCDFMVEDKLETLLVCRPGTYRICVSYPWNDRGGDYDERHFIHRVSNLTEAYEYIKSVIDEEERSC